MAKFKFVPHLSRAFIECPMCIDRMEGTELCSSCASNKQLILDLCATAPIIRSISKVRYAGKWAELWFFEGTIDNNKFSYHLAVKRYQLDEAIEDGRLVEDIANRGLIGRRLVLVKSANHSEWNILCFAAGRWVEESNV
jgi:hypothetical protein